MLARGVLAFVVAAVIELPGRALAGGGAATDAYEGIEAGRVVDVHGLLDLYFQGGFYTSHAPPLRAFDDRVDTPSLGFARLTLAHAPETFGFRLDVGGGDLANAYRDSDPAKTAHPDVTRGLSYVEQAFVTAVLPFGRGLAVDIGKFGTPVGLEENESLTNWNYSRGILFTLVEPTYHIGARATYRTTETLALSVFWLNGWNANALEGDGMRSFGAAVTWNPTKRAEIVLDYVAGLERAPTHLSDPTLSFRHELDFYATYDLTDRIAFATSIDYGRDAGGASWGGVAGYGRAQILPWFAAALRGEHVMDTSGFMTGAKQRVVATTATLEAKGRVRSLTVVSRLEYRRDQSDVRFFTPGLNHQDTLTLALITAF